MPEPPDFASGWWQAILAALSGGVLTRYLDRHFGAKQRVQDRLADMESRLREELRKEKDDLRAEIAVLRKELDDWLATETEAARFGKKQ